MCAPTPAPGVTWQPSCSELALPSSYLGLDTKIDVTAAEMATLITTQPQ